MISIKGAFEDVQHFIISWEGTGGGGENITDTGRGEPLRERLTREKTASVIRWGGTRVNGKILAELEEVNLDKPDSWWWHLSYIPWTAYEGVGY